MELLQKRGKKVKNGQMLIRREDPRLIAFDHFFEFGIADDMRQCGGNAAY
jgi:hypothetical protein